jgi:hypothetical protein
MLSSTTAAKLSALKSTLVEGSDSYRFRGQGVLRIEKVVRSGDQRWPLQYGQGSVRLSRFPKINTLQDCDTTEATYYHAIYVSLSHFDMSSHLFCTDQKSS